MFLLVFLLVFLVQIGPVLFLFLPGLALLVPLDAAPCGGGAPIDPGRRVRSTPAMTTADTPSLFPPAAPSDPPVPGDLVPLKDAARSVDRSPSTLRDWIRAGELRAYKGPGHHESNRPTLVSAEELRLLVVKSGKLANPPRRLPVEEEELRARLVRVEEEIRASQRAEVDAVIRTAEIAQREADLLKQALETSQRNVTELRDALEREIARNNRDVDSEDEDRPSDLLDYNQAATEFDRSRNTIRWWVRSGQLRSWLEGEGNHQRRLVSRAEVQALVVQAGKLAVPGGPGRGAIPEPAPAVPTAAPAPDLLVEVATLRGEVAGLRGELSGARGELAAVRLALEAERFRVASVEERAEVERLRAAELAQDLQAFKSKNVPVKMSWWTRLFGGAK